MKLNRHSIPFIVAACLLVSAAVVIWSSNHELVPSANNYDDCVKAGGRIAESYPEQCFPPDGGTGFTNPHHQLPAGN